MKKIDKKDIFFAKTTAPTWNSASNNIHRKSADGYVWFAEHEYVMKNILSFYFSIKGLPCKFVREYSLPDAAINLKRKNAVMKVDARVRVLYPFCNKNIDRPVEIYSDLLIPEQRMKSFVNSVYQLLKN